MINQLLIICTLLSGFYTTNKLCIVDETKIINYINESYDSNVEVTIKFENKYYDERKEKADYYIINNNFIKVLGIEDKTFNVSKYSPFAFINLSYEQYKDTYADILRYTSFGFVDNIYIEEKIEIIEEDSSVNTGVSSGDIPISYAKEMINVDNSSYTGYDVKIGIIDSGRPDTTNLYSHNIGGYEDSVNSVSDHTTFVSSIIAGDYGIACDATLYFGTYNDVKGAIEYMIDNNVRIINNSWGNISYLGCYGSLTAYLDYISNHQNIIFVKSAGNRHNDKMITQPGTGLNVVSVGSVDRYKNVSYFSSYAVDSSISSLSQSPNLVAPGENLYFTNSSDKDSGTSYAAPMVTATLALLLEEFPQYSQKPEVLISALLNGASHIPGHTTNIDNHAGYGLLNYEETRKLLSEGCVDSFEILQSVNLNSICYTKSINVMPNSQLDVNFVRMYNSAQMVFASDYASISVPCDIYTISIYDNYENLIQSSSSIGNIAMISIFNNYSYYKNYIIKIKLTTDSNETTSTSAAVTWNQIHTHSITCYKENDNPIQHRFDCPCGYNGYANHVWTVTSAKGLINQYQIVPDYIPLYVCTACGYQTRTPPIGYMSV